MPYSNVSIAIVAFIMLIASIAIGIRCFADFDRGLQRSKTQSELPPSKTVVFAEVYVMN